MSVLSFEFEKPIGEIEAELARERENLQEDPERDARVAGLEQRLTETRHEVYSSLSPWQRVQIARHASRPHSLDYIRQFISEWTELRGDRAFGDDPAVVTGLGRFLDRPVAVIGQQKGSDTKDNIARNFGMMHPEGYRKALRVMKLAERYELPVLVFIDTTGAFPGIGAEERGQAEAIARNMMEMSALRTPILCTVIGEGASGGALGIGVGDRLLMMEYSWYCVISPEGCASILWRDSARAPEAAAALKLTPTDLQELQLVDQIVTEPLGGAHHDPAAAADSLREALSTHLEELCALPLDELLERRFQKYRKVGAAEM